MNNLDFRVDLIETGERATLAAGARLDRFVKAELVRRTAVMSRRTWAAAQAEVANNAMLSFVAQLYEATEGGADLWHVGDYTVGLGGRIQIPAPWSRTHYANYHLTDHAGRVLRSYIVWVLAQLPQHARLLECDGEWWYLNLHNFGSEAAAVDWLHTYATITADMWLEFNGRQRRRGAQTPSKTTRKRASKPRQKKAGTHGR